jgi:hypothetical protein
VRRERFRADQLVAVARPPFLGWTPTAGERVRLRSGGPRLHVHQVGPDWLVVVPPGRAQHIQMPLACVEPDGLLVA